MSDLPQRSLPMTGLLPCPFCGGEPEVLLSGHIITCSTGSCNSHVEVYMHSPEASAEAWNTRKSGHAQCMDLDVFIASNGAMTREILALRSKLDEARNALALADKMISDHIEKFHDFDYEPHQVPQELANLRMIEHHLMGSLILDEEIAAIVADSSTPRTSK